MPDNGTNGWNEYQKLVLDKLYSHDKLLSDINKELTGVKIQLAQLNIKAGIWGAMGASIPAAIAILISFLR